MALRAARQERDDARRERDELRRELSAERRRCTIARRERDEARRERDDVRRELEVAADVGESVDREQSEMYVWERAGLITDFDAERGRLMADAIRSRVVLEHLYLLSLDLPPDATAAVRSFLRGS